MQLASRPSIGLPVHEAIRRALDGDGTAGDGDDVLPRATAEQVQDVCDWIAANVFSDAWQQLDDREALEAKGLTYEDVYADCIFSMTTYMRTQICTT
eukprot:251121-Prymnesium_polylepis.1